MEIDAYQNCPCHAEKKIKFCCGKEIVTDLNQILAKNTAGQALAALEQIDRVIKKSGPQDCLLTIKTHILISHGEIEKAKAANNQFLEKSPKHSTGLHHQSLIRLAENDVSGAVESLQDAMENIVGDEIPVAMAAAFRMVGLGLIQHGHLVAARAHWRFALYLKGDRDQELSQMLFDTFRIPDASLLLKQEFRMLPPSAEQAETEWGKKYTTVLKAVNRGLFRKAYKFLKKIDANFEQQAVVVRGLAILAMQLGYTTEIAPAWRRYSRLEGLTELAAIEAESLAQLFDGPDPKNQYDIVRVTFELTEFAAALEKMLSEKRLASAEELTDDPLGEGPAPRQSFYLLDRPLVSASELNPSNVSDVTSELLMYGKLTDRAARVEWIVVKENSYESDLQFLKSLLGDLVSGEPKVQTIGQVDAVARAMTWNWQLPPGVSRDEHTVLVKAKYREVLRENWAQLPFAVLENETPMAASKNSELKLPLQALLVSLELGPHGQFDNGLAIAELRDSLGVPKPAMIQPQEPVASAPSPLEQLYWKFDDLNNESLLELQTEALAIGNLCSLRRILPEVLARPSIVSPPRDVTYSLLAQVIEDDEKGLECLAQARAEAKLRNQPIGVYLVQEFEYRLSCGMTEKLPALLQTIEKNHLQEPQVRDQLARTLERFGLLPRPNNAPPAPPSAAPPTRVRGSFWSGQSTPVATDDVAAPAQTETAPAASKLWIPE